MAKSKTKSKAKPRSRAKSKAAPRRPAKAPAKSGAKRRSDDELFATLTATARARIESRVGTTTKPDVNNPQQLLEEAYASKLTADHLESMGNDDRVGFYRDRVKSFLDRIREIEKAGGVPFASGRPAVVDDDVTAVRDAGGRVVPGRVKMRDGRVEGQSAKAGDEVWQTEPDEIDDGRAAVVETPPA